ncbi:glycosyltransferase family 2 protein [Actinomyces sp.]|uniref:glycosyltransferase family 2 protein n=1 Tax=Actinomyces sp. TaxID=29317 RepID=UPI0026DBCEEF|nr:glycosyltransferase [Actinomyces sp.]MDO4901448.1 glycosyltransferase [Actinomyces sp.]
MTPRVRATVAVLTFHRPEQVRHTVRVVHAQASATPAWCDADVLVVDNDPSGSGRDAVDSLALPGVHTVIEAVPGISAGRNRALNEAVSAGRELLLFIDDDGTPAPGWLTLMVERWRETRAAAVAGWVDTHYQTRPSPWILAGGFFERTRFPDYADRPAAACGNLLLDLRQLGDLRFNGALGLSGGEDTLLTRTLVARGGRIVFARDAVVVDQVATDRVTRRWVLARQISHGNTSGLLDLYFSSNPFARAGVLAGGFGRVVVGLARVGWGEVTRDLRMNARGWRLAARGAGMVLAGLGLSWNEYARTTRPLSRLVRAPRSLAPGAFLREELPTQ